MRIAVLGDIHGNLCALEAVLEDSRAKGAERYLVLGDLVMKGPRPNEVVEIIRQLPGQVIQGNTDDFFCRGQIAPGYKARSENEQQLIDILTWARPRLTPEHFDYLSQLPPAAIEEIDGIRLVLSHGSPRHNMDRLLLETPESDLKEMLSGVEADVVLAAHTHVPMVREFERYLLINSGSVGLSLDGDGRASYCLLEVAAAKSPQVVPTMVRVAYDIEKTIGDAGNLGFPHARAYHESLTTGGVRGLR